MKRLPRPVKAALAERSWDVEVTRGWARLQIERRVRGPRVSPVLAAAAVVLALAGVAWRQLQREPARPSVDELLVSAPESVARPALCAEEPKVAAARFSKGGVHGRQASLSAARRPVPPAPACSTPLAEPDVVGELLVSVEEAWKQQDLPRAEGLLLDVASHHEDDPRAAQALFLLGRLQLEYRHDADGAAECFHRALELDPPEELVVPLWQAYELASQR